MVTFVQRLALGVLALLALASPAGAAEVARLDGASLDARDSRRAGFCLRLAERDPALGGGSGTCGRAPWRPHRSELIAWVVDRDRLLAAGAVPASVVRAEAELVDGRRIGFDTVAGPRYRGHYAGRLRFFLAALPLADRSDSDAGGLVAVRFFAADGTLAGVAASDREGTRISRRTLLLRERVRGRSTTVTAEELRVLAPTPLALDRFEELICITVRTRTGSFEGGSSRICNEPGPRRPELFVVPESGCDGLRTVISGFVGDAVTAVRLRLGSGRVREVRARTLRDRRGVEHRYVATAVPREEAVRSVAAVGAEAEYELGEPPGGLPCLDQSSMFAYSYLFGLGEGGAPRPPAGDEQVVAETGGHRLLARDAEADRLCAGVDALRADGGDCTLPAVNGEDAFLRASGGVIGAVLPAEVARVRLPGGREVPTVVGSYGGRYAGRVRFLLAEVPTTADVRVRLLDAAGAVIATLPVFDPEALSEPPLAGPVRLASGRGWRLEAERHRYGPCVSIALRGEEGSCLFGVPDADGAIAAVGCTPRVAVIAGMLSRGARGARAILRGGGTLRARIVRVPRRFGGGRAWVLALPRKARVKALRIGGGRFAFPLLPAAAQCGYFVYAPSLFGVGEPELELRSP
jgi:hypothetical protein